MAEEYYERKETLNTDGTPVFATAGDSKVEREVEKLLEEKWKCKIHRFARLDPLDRYAVKDGRTVCFLEIKGRGHPKGKFPTAYFNIRKYFHLLNAYLLWGRPAFYVVKWSCGSVGYVNVVEVDVSNVPVGGCKRRVKSHTDIEAMIEVPIEKFKEIV